MAPWVISVLSRNAARGDDRLAGLQAPDHLQQVLLAARPGHHVLRSISACPDREENQVRVVLALNGLLRDDHGPVFRADPDLGAAELVGAQPARRVAHPGPDADGPGGLIHLGPGPRHPAFKNRTVGARDGEGHRLAEGHRGDVAFIHVDPEPHRRGVGHGKELARGFDRFPEDGVPHDDRARERTGDVQPAGSVLGLEHLGQVVVAKAQVPELLLGVLGRGLGLIEGRAGGHFVLQRQGILLGEGRGPLIVVPGQIQDRLRGEVLRPGRADLGGIDHRQDRRPPGPSGPDRPGPHGDTRPRAG